MCSEVSGPSQKGLSEFETALIKQHFRPSGLSVDYLSAVSLHRAYADGGIPLLGVNQLPSIKNYHEHFAAGNPAKYNLIMQLSNPGAVSLLNLLIGQFNQALPDLLFRTDTQSMFQMLRQVENFVRHGNIQSRSV